MPVPYKQLHEIKRAIDLSTFFDNFATQKRFGAIVSQAGTAAPTATVVENGLGASPVFARTGTGVYTLTLTGAWKTGKTVVNVSHSAAGSVTVALTSANVITITSLNASAAATDVILANTFIEIIVYP